MFRGRREERREEREATRYQMRQRMISIGRKIVIIPEVDTTWKRRADHYDRIAVTVAEIAESHDGNFLALFPSYAFLREVAERMPTIRKQIMVQRTDMTDYERNAILDIVRRGGDNLIMAVSGGMYAEGVDYRGDMLSGVMVVGPALAEIVTL